MFHGLLPDNRTRKRSAGKILGEPKNAYPRLTGVRTWPQMFIKKIVTVMRRRAHVYRGLIFRY